jgi:hypothetical protein
MKTISKYQSWRILFLAALVLFVYGNSLNNPFIWDDQASIVNNDHINHPKQLIIEPLYASQPTADQSYWRPFQSLTYFLDHRIWGLNPLGYHLTNLACHLLNALLIFFLLKKIGQSEIAAFFACVFFILNPIFTTSVTYISGRADLLVLFFILLSLLALMKFQEGNSIATYALSLFLFLAALFSKESAVLGLGLFMGQVTGSRGTKSKVFCGYLVVFFFYLFLRSQILRQHSLLMPETTGLHLLLLNSFKMVLAYVMLFFFPFNPHLGRTLSGAASFFQPLVFVPAWILIASFAYLSYRNSKKIFLFGLFWYLSTIIPLSLFDGLFSGIGHDIIMPENNLYLASAGLLCIFATAVFEFFRSNRKNILIISLLGIYLVFLGAETIRVNKIWSDPIKFYDNILESNKGSESAYVTYTNLGVEYKRRRDFGNAIKMYERALRIKKDPVIYHDLGNIYLTENNLTQARRNFLEAIRLNRNFAFSYAGLGLVSLRENNAAEAKKMFTRALQIDPGDQQIRHLIEKYFVNF